MKSKFKRISKSTMSVILSLCMIMSCMTVGLIATDAAKVDSDPVGIGSAIVKGSWNWSNELNCNGTFASVTLAANTTYYFEFVVDNVTARSNVTISGTTNYTFPKNGSESIKLKTDAAGTYKFKVTGSDDGSVSTRIEFPEYTGPTTWTAVGDNTALFGTAWAPTLATNNLTKDATGTIWRKTWNNVQLSAGTIKYKVAKNHSWTTAYPSENKTATVPSAGLYNVEVTYNESGNAVNMTLTAAAKKNLTVVSVEHAVVKATYNDVTYNEGQTIQNVPQGATVSISVTPDTGYQCTGITSSGGGTISGSMYSFTLKMPGADTDVTANISPVTLKKIYFNNSYTLYGQVYAHVYDMNGTAKTYEYLGPYPGTTMTRLANSNILYIEVPGDVDYIKFTSGEGYTTGEMEIPWGEYDYLKYTAPYGHNEAPTTDNGGTWGNYIYGSDNKRTNEYTVSKGSTMSASNLFTGITATLYDYFVDDEADGSWLTSIANDVKNYNNDGLAYNDPYKDRLNKALSDYADTAHMPKYGVTYPLYFGNLLFETSNDYYTYIAKPNNSNYLGTINNHKRYYDAVTGLSGKTLANSTIHYYKSSATNENGAPMAMFDEDFLSGENSQNKALATILRTSSFPVRKETNLKTIILDLNGYNGWESDSAKIAANFHNGTTTSNNLRVWTTPIGDHKYMVTVPDGYTQVEWQRIQPGEDLEPGENLSGQSLAADHGCWNKTNVGAFGSNNVYKFTGDNFNSSSGSWSTNSTLAQGHTYYEYDSTGGKDNAFITDINTTNKTANINYYAGASNAVKSPEKKSEGFFPFDYNNVISNTRDVTAIYLNPSGGWKLNNERYAAYFMDKSVSPEVTEWANFTYDNTTSRYKCDIPDDRYKGQQVIICRMDGSTTTNNWSNKWNQTADLQMPTTNDVCYSVSNGTTNEGTWDSINGVTFEKTNGYADSNHYARDQGFGMKLVIPFNLTGSGEQNGINADGTPQVFDFSGDDDLWVFVDDKLVLDLGGAHGRTTGSINFQNKTITANNTQAIASGVDRNGYFGDGFNTNANYVHTMTIYYMERGMFESNLKFGFSFHAIPNQFWIDKKIKTKDIINAGFYQDNNQTGTASNKDATLTDREGRFISKFEASYQNEQFTVVHKYGSSASGATTPASGKNYTIDNDTNSYTTPAEGTYPIKHDLGNAFIGQFTTGDWFNLQETYGDTNKYLYTPVFSVWDQANNNQAINFTGDNSDDGYTFHFNPTTTVTGGMENTNIKARFENEMVAHNLMLTKQVNDPTDTTTPFTLKVMFDFENDGNNNYIAYPLYCDVDGVRTQLSKTGEITITPGQILEIEEIPQNAKIQVTEVNLPSNSRYTFNNVALTNMAGVALTGTDINNITNGVQFVMHSNDILATVNNKQADPLAISHNLHPDSTGDAFCYVTAQVIDKDDEVVQTYDQTQGVIIVDPQYLKKDSTDKLVITLDTTPKDGSSFTDFYEKISGTMALLSALGTPFTKNIDKATMTATITVDIKDLFNSTTGVQLYTELPFYSKVDLSTYNFNITKSTDGVNTDETFDFEVYKKNGSTYEKITTDPGFTYTGTGTGSFSNETLTLSSGKTAKMTVTQGDIYKVIEKPKSNSGFEYNASSSSVNPDNGVNAINNGFEEITISSDTTVTFVNKKLYTGIVSIQYKNSSEDTTWKTDFSQADDYTTTTGTVTHADVSMTTGSRTQQVASGGSFTVNKDDSNLTSGYTFVGWVDGNGNDLGTTLDATELLANGDKTFIAQYIKTDPQGSVKIYHQLDTTNSTGDGDLYAKVQVMQGTTVVWTSDNDPTKTWNKSGTNEPLTYVEVPLQYIVHKPDNEKYTVRVTLSYNDLNTNCVHSEYHDATPTTIAKVTDAEYANKDYDVNNMFEGSAGDGYTFKSATYSDIHLYSTIIQKYTGIVSIQYKNSSADTTWKTDFSPADNYSDTTGDVTNVTVSMTAGSRTQEVADYVGTSESFTVNKNDSGLTSGYTFVGWVDGNGNDLGTTLDATELLANGDKTFIARYIKGDPTPAVNVKHKLITGTTGGTPVVKVEVYKGNSNTPVHTYNFTNAANGIDIDPQYLTYKTDAADQYHLKIYLKTTPDTNYVFQNFYTADNDASANILSTGTDYPNAESISNNGGTGDSTATIRTLDVNDMYTMNSSTGELTFDTSYNNIAYYSKLLREYTANVAIQYFNSSEDTTPDNDTLTTVTSGSDQKKQGSTTAAKVYFNNDPTTTSDKKLQGETFTAAAKDDPNPANGYTFIGWYLYDGSSYKEIIESGTPTANQILKSAAQVADGNKTFIARYRKADETGSVTIDHSLISTAPANCGTPTLSVEVYNDEGTKVATYPAAGTSNSVTIDDTYIKYDTTNNYKLRVILNTNVNNGFRFDDFYKTDGTSNAVGDSDYQSRDVTTNPATVTINDIDVNSTFFQTESDGRITFKSSATPIHYFSNIIKQYTATVKIQYKDDNFDNDWNDESSYTNNVQGDETGAKVYFGTDDTSRTVTVDSGENFNYTKADPNPANGYDFVDWYYYDEDNDSYLKIVTGTAGSGEISETEAKKADADKTFVARYHKNTLNKYEFTYRYKSRHLNSNSTDENDRVYGEQTFTSKGEITAEELAEYFEVNGSTSFKFKDDVKVNGKVTKSYKQEFIASKSPYEKNFKEKITWNFSAATVNVVYDSTNKYWTVKTAADVTADYDYDPKLSAEFDLPYAYNDPTTTTSIVPGENDGVIPVTEQVTIGGKTTDIVRKSNNSIAIKFRGNAADDNIMRARFLKWVTLNEIKSLEDLNNARATNPNAKALFIKAPESIYDNQDNEYVFRYWSMKDLEEIEYAKCYSNEFNMALYQSSKIEPIYELKTGGNASQLDENAAFDANNKMATIAFLENSRMQWNENGGGSKISDDLKHYSGDKLVTDFALAFDYQGLELRSKNNYAFGVVVEKLEGGEIDPDNVPTNAQLTAEHKNDDLTAAKNAVQAELVSKIYDNMVENNKIQKSYFSSDNANTYQISSSPTKNTLDNKNELEYYFAMDKFTNSYVDENNHSKGITSTETGLHLNKYRAFSFLMVPCKRQDSETVELTTESGAGTGLYVKFIISDPVYFTNYTEASISNGATN